MTQRHLDIAAAVAFVIGVAGTWFFGRRLRNLWRQQ